jgi:hypothetical protein
VEARLGGGWRDLLLRFGAPSRLTSGGDARRERRPQPGGRNRDWVACPVSRRATRLPWSSSARGSARRSPAARRWTRRRLCRYAPRAWPAGLPRPWARWAGAGLLLVLVGPAAEQHVDPVIRRRARVVVDRLLGDGGVVLPLAVRVRARAVRALAPAPGDVGHRRGRRRRRRVREPGGGQVPRSLAPVRGELEDRRVQALAGAGLGRERPSVVAKSVDQTVAVEADSGV